MTPLYDNKLNHDQLTRFVETGKTDYSTLLSSILGRNKIGNLVLVGG